MRVPFSFIVNPPAIGGYTAYATQFAGDGQCDIEINGVSTGSNSLKFMLSCWVNFSGLNGTFQQIFTTNNGTPSFNKQASNVIRISATSADTGIQMDQDTAKVAAITSSTGWVHVAISVDKTIAVARAQMYINGVECAQVNFFGHSNDSQTFTLSDFYFAVGGNWGRANPFAGAISEFYWNDSESLDLSNSTNLEKFRSASGHPVDLGSTGSTPTGTAPRIYLRDPYTSFYTDRSGNGNNFTKQGTTALASATAP